MPACQKCHLDFLITPRDMAFYARLQVPPPTFCFTCRLQRKMIFRNDRNLERRPCSKCGTEMISMYSSQTPFTIWCEKCWSEDSWEAQDFAQEYDFTQPFFKQFQQLFQRVPRQHLLQKNNENSPWVNSESNSKNCYMNSGGLGNEDGAYNTWSGFTSNCFDNYSILKSQLCYEDNMVTTSYQVFFSNFVFDSRQVYFSENCTNSSNLIGCINLKNKSYRIFNQPVTPEEFTEELKKLRSFAYQQDFLKRFADFRLTQIHQYVRSRTSIDCTGDYLEKSKGCLYCFTTVEAQDCSYSFGIGYIKDSYDVFSGSMGMELCYENTGAGDKCYKVSFSRICSDSHDVLYSSDLTNCSDCFGCVGLKNKQFCILNKQYSEQEYKQLLPQVLQHMNQQPYVDKAGRTYGFGEFFPAELSPFTYNESMVQDFYTLTQEQAVRQGFDWRSAPAKHFTPTLMASALSDSIDQVQDSILKEIIECAHAGVCTDSCTQVFTLIKSELDFLRKFGLPLPRLCPTCRHVKRIKQKNPMKLWERACQCAGTTSQSKTYLNQAVHDHAAATCSRMVSTTYAPERPEMIYCQECYQGEVV